MCISFSPCTHRPTISTMPRARVMKTNTRSQGQSVCNTRIYAVFIPLPYVTYLICRRPVASAARSQQPAAAIAISIVHYVCATVNCDAAQIVHGISSNGEYFCFVFFIFFSSTSFIPIGFKLCGHVSDMDGKFRIQRRTKQKKQKKILPSHTYSV